MNCLYTIADVTEILKMDKNLVYDLVRKGYLIPLKCKTFKISSLEIEKFIQKWTGYDLSDLDNPKLITMEGK